MKIILFGLTYQELQDNLSAVIDMCSIRSLFEVPEINVLSSLDTFYESCERLSTMGKMSVVTFNPNQIVSENRKSYYTNEEFRDRVAERGLEIWTTEVSSSLPEVVKTFTLVNGLNIRVVYIDSKESIGLSNELFYRENVPNKKGGKS